MKWFKKRLRPSKRELQVEIASLKTRYNDLLGNASIDHTALQFALDRVSKLEAVIKQLLTCVNIDYFPLTCNMAKEALNPQKKD